MNRAYDVLYKRDENQGRGVWIKYGVMQEKVNGKIGLKLDVIPVGSAFDGWLVITPRRESHDRL